MDRQEDRRDQRQSGRRVKYSDLPIPDRKRYVASRHYHRKANGRDLTIEQWLVRRKYQRLGETCDRPAQTKYGPPGGRPDQAHRHRVYCKRHGWRTWLEYQAAVRKHRPKRETPREMALRVLRERGLEK